MAMHFGPLQHQLFSEMRFWNIDQVIQSFFCIGDSPLKMSPVMEEYIEALFEIIPDSTKEYFASILHAISFKYEMEVEAEPHSSITIIQF